MRYIIAALLLSFISCQQEKSVKPGSQFNVIPDEKEKYTKKEASPTEDKINDSVYRIIRETQESIFNLYYSVNQKDVASFDSLTIRDKSIKSTRRIRFKKDYFLMPYEITFRVDNDANFDGFNDIQLSNYVGNYNATYSFWLYNSKRHVYEHNTMLDSINNPQIDIDKKEITSEWRAAFVSFHSERYRWDKRKLVLFEETVKDYPMSSHEEHETHRILKNGKYYTTERVLNKTDINNQL